MALQDTLQQQYNRTLQGTIGQSQRSRQQAQRASQGQSGTTDPSVDWAARQASGFRGAGFNPVSLSNVPQAQIQATKDTFGPSTAGGYVEGGKNVEGFYGDTNPYTEQGSESLFNKAGFTNLGKADSMDLTYASLIPELQNNLMKYDGVGSLGNLYGRNGADPRKIQVNEQTLANNLTSRYNQTYPAGYTTTLDQILGSSRAQQSEYLSQLLTQGGITGRSLSDRGSYGGNQINDVISGDLMKLFGSKDISYGGKNYGTVLDMAGYENPLQNQWSESSTNTKRKWYGPTKTTTSWDQGGSNLYRGLNNSDWWSQNAKNMGNGQIMLTPEQLAISPGFSSIDNYTRDSGSETQKQGILQKIWERTSPTSLLLKQDFEKMQPIGAAVGNYFVPGLGSALNAIDSYSKGDSGGGQNWLKSAGMSYLGGSLNDMGAGASVGTATGLGTTAGNAIVAGGMGGLGAALQGGNAKNILTGIAAGGLGSGLGDAVAKGFGGYMGDMVGQGTANTVGNVAGSMTSQGLQNLLSNNKLGKNMGMAAVQGGMSSLGNLFAPKGSTPQQVQQMNSAGKNAGSLVKTISKMNKSKVK